MNVGPAAKVMWFSWAAIGRGARETPELVRARPGIAYGYPLTPGGYTPLTPERVQTRLEEA
jgi:hypothetical protein